MLLLDFYVVLGEDSLVGMADAIVEMGRLQLGFIPIQKRFIYDRIINILNELYQDSPL